MTLPAPDLSLPPPLAFWRSRNLIAPVASVQICEVRIDQPIAQEHSQPPVADDGRRT